MTDLSIKTAFVHQRLFLLGEQVLVWLNIALGILFDRWYNDGKIPKITATCQTFNISLTSNQWVKDWI